MLKVTLITVVAAVGLLLIYAATRPDNFRIERSVRIEAPPERVYGLIDDLHQFNRWNPFLRKDPAAQGTYSGTPSGKGARYAWQGEKVGVGQMEIVDTAAPANVTMNLDFIKPFEAHNMADFTLKPEAGATQVTWAMYGPAPFLSKLMQVFVSMDRMVGKDFEDGLSNLKTLAEAS
ncbi:SRPBCC family protein [Paraburkholderia sp. SEWSISQ10-3 4]|uniref:SRPBCC family protein n=1 Tax=Paraburkholderia TaxID=1822464 RepID=UPI0022589608|nr:MULTISPECIES: SRPBCC family protein [Paraburkholderia]MCX4137285.1 SRPBCC family protein [Paraburkholderia aspalathi]MDN7169977.1 SRPBCC family protein [Paraburkholderia sp. SEWSISQ10-3 4]MDQ6499616.1 SRPBCC family protein [Paraburkholderia aspalathi]